MRLEIQCEDRIGMVSEILSLLVSCQIDVRLIEIESKQRCIYCGFTDIPFAQLQNLLADIRRLDSVEDVKTVMFTPFEQEHSSLYSLLESLPDGVILVDLKGKITMMTKKAENVFHVNVADLLYAPFSQLVKGMAVPKSVWGQPQSNVKKRLRVGNEKLLLEINPILVADDIGGQKPVGSAVYVKSERVYQNESSAKLLEGVNGVSNAFQSSEVKSNSMQRALSNADVFSSLDSPLLIQGAFGSGKKYIAQAMFENWKSLQCGISNITFRHANKISIKEIETLYYEKGWLVIEDFQGLQPDVQRWLANSLNGLGGDQIHDEVRARIVCLTSLNTSCILSDYGFDKTLFFILSSLVLSIPSLNERKEDIEGLLINQLTELSGRYNLPVPSLSKQVKMKLCLYGWPGNLKELNNVCSQLLLTIKHRHWQVEDIHLPEEESMVPTSLIDDSLEATVKCWEAALLKKMYVDFPSTRRLAKAVGMSHSTIATKLKEYGIQTKKPD
ncbi:sigma 54-interacting transcriptional regulator [Marinomonas sp.]|nr:TyrR/PhhR family helix-turn-helix DNA-binding protein [Marinomonas sp.]MDB4837382.1 sigma 54-interacting transcriptional regulator [Marinomonas sp.]